MANAALKTANGVNIVNPSDHDWCRKRYLFAFGAYGWTRCLVWANSLDDALDEAVDWLVDNAPGLLCDDAVADEYRLARAEGLDEDAARERATLDTTCAGNAGNYLNSWEWSVLENPSRKDLVEPT